MGEYDSPKRPLPYPLQNALVFSTTTEDDTEPEAVSSFVWPADSDERVIVPFYLSLNEYNVLASTIDVGSDIAYGADALRVMWLWQRNMRIEVPLCDAILNCIETNEAVREAIMNLVGDNFLQDVRTDPANPLKLQKQDSQTHAWSDFATLPTVPTTTQIGISLLQDGEFMGNVCEEMAHCLPEDENFIRRLVPNLPTLPANDYEPQPTASEPDALCNAATYVVQRVRDLIVDIYARLADAITPGEVFSSLLAQNGWSVGALYDLIAFGAGSLENEMENLAAFDAAAPDLICELISYELDKDAFTDWIDATYAGDATLRDMLKYAITAASADGQYATWVAVGATMTTADCSDCTEEPPDGDCMDLTDIDNPWSPFEGPTSGWGTKTSSGLKPDLYIADGKYYLRFVLVTAVIGLSSSVTFKFNQPTSNMRFTYRSGGVFYTKLYSGTAATEITFDDFEGAHAPYIANGTDEQWRIEGGLSGGVVDSGSMRIEEMCNEPV